MSVCGSVCFCCEWTPHEYRCPCRQKLGMGSTCSVSYWWFVSRLAWQLGYRLSPLEEQQRLQNLSQVSSPTSVFWVWLIDSKSFSFWRVLDFQIRNAQPVSNCSGKYLSAILIWINIPTPERIKINRDGSAKGASRNCAVKPLWPCAANWKAETEQGHKKPAIEITLNQWWVVLEVSLGKWIFGFLPKSSLRKCSKVLRSQTSCS